MAKINTKKAAECNMLLNERKYISWDAAYLKRISNKAERTASKALVSADAVNDEILMDEEIYEESEYDEFSDVSFAYERDFYW